MTSKERYELVAKMIEELAVKGFDMQEFAELVRDLSKTLVSLSLDKEEDEEKKLYSRVTAILHEVGVPTHVVGYQLLRSAIIMTYKNPEMIEMITKDIYPEIAKQYKRKVSSVERCMRHAIECMWKKESGVKKYTEYTNSPQQKKAPTNSEFISMIAEIVKLENM